MTIDLDSRDLSAGLANAAGLARILGCSRAHVGNLEARYGFPEPIPLAGGSTRYRGSRVWPVAEVLAWLEDPPIPGEIAPRP